ncbi:MAG TPA: PQQ-dependent sugar dehydrogenase [Paraburkholderia sp.]|jgi:glucose/arabinose dehydrogenase
MSRYIEHWLSQSRVIAALAVLLTLLSVANLAHAVPPDAAAVPTAAAVGQTVTCQPTSTTRPQPTLPKGFTEQILYSGCLNQPTAIAFNGNKSLVFVAEKGGKIWQCDLSAAPRCFLFADLGSKGEVCNDADRGLLGLAVDPQSDGNSIYVLYTTPPAIGASCSGDVLTHGQLSLLTGPDHETKILPPEGSSSQTWCFFYSSHSIGDLTFGADNKTLYVSAGEGASFIQVDNGQLDNACGDGTNLPQGAFRSQGFSPYYDGVILRIANPGTTTQSVDVVANGLRNPFRFARVPGITDDLYVGNVGWNDWEAIDFVSGADKIGNGKGPNFGWPCYEGWNPDNLSAAPQAAYNNPPPPDTSYCGRVVGPVAPPFFAYAHQSYVSPEDSRGRTCGGKPNRGGPDQSGSVISAIGFTDDTSATYPAQFKNALYFGDLLRQCIWTVQPANGVPVPQTFAKGLEGGPVDLKAGPSGDLFYVDIVTSTVRRITHK